MLSTANRALIQKTLLTQGCIAAVQKAMEICGGERFYRVLPLGRLPLDLLAKSVEEYIRAAS